MNVARPTQCRVSRLPSGRRGRRPASVGVNSVPGGHTNGRKHNAAASPAKRAADASMVGSVRVGDRVRSSRLTMGLALTLSAGVWPVLGAGEPDPKAEAVLEAVFRQQVKEWLDTSERSRGTVVCLAIDTGEAPQS